MSQHHLLKRLLASFHISLFFFHKLNVYTLESLLLGSQSYSVDLGIENMNKFIVLASKQSLSEVMFLFLIIIMSLHQIVADM